MQLSQWNSELVFGAVATVRAVFPHRLSRMACCILSLDVWLMSNIWCLHVMHYGGVSVCVCVCWCAKENIPKFVLIAISYSHTYKHTHSHSSNSPPCPSPPSLPPAAQRQTHASQPAQKNSIIRIPDQSHLFCMHDGLCACLAVCVCCSVCILCLMLFVDTRHIRHFMLCAAAERKHSGPALCHWWMK